MSEPPPSATRPRLGARAWVAPVLAAVIALLAGLPGLLALPPLDRDESRFAQATAQMLETGDYVRIAVLDQPREKKPVGIHWLQAASVAAFSSAEAREIWAYRLPSLLGAMLAAAACAWGAAAFWGGRGGLIAGAVLGVSVLLSTEAGIAKTDAVLCGCVCLCMAALARLYAQSLEPDPPAKAARHVTMLFWAAMALGLLVKGPVILMTVGLAGLLLWAVDRRAPWAKRMRWGWGLIAVLAVIGPWAVAITIATDGGFWGAAIGGDLAPKLEGGQESHGAPPGVHTLLSPLLLFPAALLLPAAAVVAWRRWREPGVRFALCWLIPTWIAFELLPTKLVHYPLPAYGALAFLCAAALTDERIGKVARAVGAVLSVLAGLLFGAVALYAAQQYGEPGDLPMALLTAIALGLTGLLGGVAMTRRELQPWVAATLVAGVVSHGVLVAGLAPRLSSLWVSERTAEAARITRLPRGVTAAAGYSEPSLIFTLGSGTRLVDAAGAAALVAAGRPAVVEASQQPGFLSGLARLGITARPAGAVSGYDYSRGEPVRLYLYRGLPVRSPNP